jgi:3-deoxy-D-manno-octulosonic-acid transferase
LGWIFFAVGFLPYILYGCFTGLNLQRIGQRLGFIKDLQPDGNQRGRIWLHGSSVGEVQAAKAIIKELQKELPQVHFVLSVMTEQGFTVARQQLGDDVAVIMAPLDLVGIVGRVAKKIRPIMYICLETELWANLLCKIHEMDIKLVLMNGRMSERSFDRYRYFPKTMAAFLNKFDLISTIDTCDAQRYIDLGADSQKVVVSGNAKFDLVMENCSSETSARYSSILGLEGQFIFVAGSTHSGEEELLLETYRALKKSEAGEDLIWIVAPRHLNRLPEVSEMLDRQRVAFALFSQVKKYGRKADVILVDVMGELAGLYSIASFVFCGGSLVNRGGHNVMEAAACGKPVFYGPSMKDFADAAQLLEDAKAGFPVANVAELTGKVLYLLAHGDEYDAVCGRARDVALAQQGSAGRQAKLIKNVLAA